jgi:hypothetical protein
MAEGRHTGLVGPGYFGLRCKEGWDFMICVFLIRLSLLGKHGDY